MPAQSPFIRKISFIVFSFSLLFIVSQNSALAQSTITAIPTRVDLSADPGQTVTAELKVRTDFTTSQIFSVNLDDFVVYDSIGTPVPVTSTAGNRWSLKSWITAPTLVPVDAHGTQIINLTFRVPLTALPGGHYAMITYQPNPDVKKGDLKQTANLIGQRVGTLLYLTVNGPITQKANLTKFMTDQFIEQGPVTFEASVQNLSDIHVNPKGVVSVYNLLNNKVAEIPVEVGNVFPEVNRDFSVIWNQKWGYGKYRADIELAYGTSGGVLRSSIYFWLFPIRLIIYILILIISILVIYILLSRRGKKHQEELEREVAELKKELHNIEEKQ